MSFICAHCTFRFPRMDKPLPKLDLNVTNRCNYRCTHCAFDSGIINMCDMPLEQIERILKETRVLGGIRYDVTGGEPLLRQDIDKIISYGKSLGFSVELVTNGSLLDENKLERFKALGLDAIAISLDGSTHVIHSVIRQTTPEQYTHTKEIIARAEKYGFKTKVNTVVFESNLEDIPNITEFCIENKLQEHGLYYFTPVGRGFRSPQQPMHPIKWLEFFRTKMRPYANSPLKITLEVPLIERERWHEEYKCIAGERKGHLQILPDENVYPCAIMASYHNPIGNLYKRTVSDVWHDDENGKKYWHSILEIMGKNHGSCVDFRGVFNFKDFDFNKYRPVCPLRKFTLQEIL